MISALVIRSLSLGGLLYPMMSVVGKSDLQSVLFEIMFQFLMINILMSGFLGLKLVAMTGVVLMDFSFISRRLSCLYWFALLKCFFHVCDWVSTF